MLKEVSHLVYFSIFLFTLKNLILFLVRPYQMKHFSASRVDCMHESCWALYIHVPRSIKILPHKSDISGDVSSSNTWNELWINGAWLIFFSFSQHHPHARDTWLRLFACFYLCSLWTCASLCYPSPLSRRTALPELVHFCSPFHLGHMQFTNSQIFSHFRFQLLNRFPLHPLSFECPFHLYCIATV